MQGQASERAFCESNFVSGSAMAMMDRVRTQFRDQLLQTSLLLPTALQPSRTCDKDQIPLVKAVLCAGLSPGTS